MTVDLREFFEATDPSRTLAVDKAQDRKFYIGFSCVRNSDMINKGKQKITFFKPDSPTCTLFIGHIG